MGMVWFVVLLAVLAGVWLGLIFGAAAGWCALCAALGRANKDIVAFLRGEFLNPKAPAAHKEHGMSENYVVWGALLAMTLVEVGLAYMRLNLLVMLVTLMGLSLIKAALIVGFFMHMKFEKKSFVLTIVPATVITILLLDVVFPDGLRAYHFREERMQDEVKSVTEAGGEHP
ncbi:MAG: cytochrome C oxidase subunit IV family protein [Planctomycetes bacterium]|nr:cytochrome C oxidase subunit IV family protein [Planctomycetota bacterium]